MAAIGAPDSHGATKTESDMIRHQGQRDGTERLAFRRGGEVTSRSGKLTVAGLFAGIGGVELGLERAGHTTELLCEVDPYALRVLEHHFGDRVDRFATDVRALDEIPDVDLVTAGFPCQDLSQAGNTRGIRGERSGLVDEVFRLLESSDPRWVLLENVPFMLSLDQGRGMQHLVDRFEDLGYSWAYRVVDTRAFGLPQRRRRVLFLASRTEDPREVLLTDDVGEPEPTGNDEDVAFGFYWTEGVRGLGWAVDAVPTLKGGSSVGIPSPPAIWMPDGRIVTPHIEDAERLQGFPRRWTRPALSVDGARAGTRWKLVGNAVSVPVAKWVGEHLREPQRYDDGCDKPLGSRRWPTAAWGNNAEGAFAAGVSEWPKNYRRRRLVEFLKAPTKPLSERASRGFYKRATSGRLRFRPGFLEAVKRHAESVDQL